MTFGIGLVVLTSPVHQAFQRFKAVLPQIAPQVNKLLYVQLIPNANASPYIKVPVAGKSSSTPDPNLTACSRAISHIYGHSVLYPNLDVRVLLAGLRSSSRLHATEHDIEAVFFDQENLPEDFKATFFDEQTFASQPHTVELKVPPNSGGQPGGQTDASSTDKVYDHVVLGGTFDRLHAGHKILLSQSLIRCNSTITVGVTAGPEMLKNKVLTDLILSNEDRVKEVKDFLVDCHPKLDAYNVVPIYDPFGPSIVDPDLELVVGSEDTVRGCNKINEVRKDKSLSELDVHIIPLIQDETVTSKDQDPSIGQVSSTNGRIRLLGTELRPPSKPWDPSQGPYLIGLTGGSASGKTNIAQYLETLGAGVVNCDRLGHQAYLPGTSCFSKVVERFGQDIVSSKDGTIDRSKLRNLVFGPDNKANLDSLNQIVWPEILNMAMELVKKLWKEDGKSVVVLDASVLLAANWQSNLHQVWVSIVDRQEAVARIVNRDKLSEEDAVRRLQSQKPNQDYVRHANVVFCSKWDAKFTRHQVDIAWNHLNEKHIKKPLL